MARAVQAIRITSGLGEAAAVRPFAGRPLPAGGFFLLFPERPWLLRAGFRLVPARWRAAGLRCAVVFDAGVFGFEVLAVVEVLDAAVLDVEARGA
jgi:hypothetical protein